MSDYLEADNSNEGIKTRLMTLIASNKRREATELLVDYILKDNHIKTTRNDQKPEMWLYKEGIYVPEARTFIKEKCREMLAEAHTTHLANEVIAKIEADTYIDEKEFFNKQNKQPYLLPVQNGLLDLKTRGLHPYTHRIPYFNKINARYDEKASCPQFKKFLEEITENTTDRAVIQEIFGFCLIREYKYEKAFMLHGANGRNGKSKLLEVLRTFLGVQNVSSKSIQALEQDPFEKNGLHNKLANIASDITAEGIKQTGVFKELTGRDTINANRKFKEHIEFVNYAKMIFACNEIPHVNTESDAFWLRWVIINFPYQFLSKELIAMKSEEEKQHVKEQDPELSKKLTTQEEIDGILLFALEGLDRLEQKGDFSKVEPPNELKVKWLRKSNSVAAFLQDQTEDSYGDYILKSDFVKEYTAYCRKHRVKSLGDKVIKRTLLESGIIETRPYEDGKTLPPAWGNIKLINNLQVLQ